MAGAKALVGAVQPATPAARRQRRRRSPAGNRAATGEHDFSCSQRRQALLDRLYDIARTADSDEVRLAAIVAWLNRVEGKPVAMTAHGMSRDPSALNDADLDHELRLIAVCIHEKIKKE